MALRCATDAPEYYGLLENFAPCKPGRSESSMREGHLASGHQHRCAHVFHVSPYFVLTYEHISCALSNGSMCFIRLFHRFEDS